MNGADGVDWGGNVGKRGTQTGNQSRFCTLKIFLLRVIQMPLAFYR